jgi:NADPH:quinone reductase-like Zn-dependent oxidoreductase
MSTYTAMVMNEPGALPAPVTRPIPEPGPTEVVVRLRATSMNYHDLVNLKGSIRGGPWPRVPMSDGAGEIAAVGNAVRSLRVGDRVVAAFSPRWLNGVATPRTRGDVLGDTRDGCLQQYLCIEESAVARTPLHLSDAEAATIPCAGVTAWTSLRGADVKAGDVVVAQGTGGVSLYVVQLAKAAGATVILTSSSDAKLDVGKSLGADHLVNYRTHPEWHKAVRELTGGEGADLVVDVGGVDTLAKSILATKMGGSIAIVGVLGGFGMAEIPYTTVMMQMQHVFGVAVGSAADLVALNAAMAATHIVPQISHHLDWTQIPEAMRVLGAQGHIGKIAITIV